MAIKHRKLFPKTQEEQNQTTINCPVFCDPSCSFTHDCLPYQDPNLTFFSPPPPLNFASPNPPISPFIIISITLLASLFLLISYYAIIIKHCGDCSRSSNTLNSQSNGGRDDENDDDYDQNGRAIIDHPIWLITTVGLNQSVINSIAACKYKKGDGLIQETDCSVCLSEFQEDETVRLLPKCNHAFHTSCIDTWLNSHTNCPLCRARIVSESANMSSGEQNSVQILSFEETQVGNHQTDDGLRENYQMRNNNGFDENRGETEDLSQINVDSNQNDGFSHNHQTNSVDKNQNLEELNEITQLRRSNSMYCCSSARSKCLNCDELKMDVKESSSIGSSSSNEGNLGNSDVLIKRSFSYGGGKSFWARNNRALNSSLPL